MIEKVKAVNNPLTIIAIFAALAEIAGTIALKIVAPELQATFIWFVMIFPALLVVLFFITLNFNPKVLYAPSDFKDEVNFLNVIGGAKQLSTNLEEVQSQLENVKTQILSDTLEQLDMAGEAKVAQVTDIVNNRIEVIQKTVENSKQIVGAIVDEYADISPRVTSALGYKILLLFQNGERLTVKELKEKFPEVNERKLRYEINRLIQQGSLSSQHIGATSVYVKSTDPLNTASTNNSPDSSK